MVDELATVELVGTVVEDGITSSSTKESSVYLDGMQAPGVVGALPNDDAIDATKT